MLNKRFTCVLLGILIFLVVIYANSFSQEIPTENLSFSSQVTSPADTHCIAKAGDLNGDNKVSLADVICFLRRCPIQPPSCRYDVNGDGLTLSIADLKYLLLYIFSEGPTPVKSGVCCL